MHVQVPILELSNHPDFAIVDLGSNVWQMVPVHCPRTVACALVDMAKTLPRDYQVRHVVLCSVLYRSKTTKVWYI